MSYRVVTGAGLVSLAALLAACGGPAGAEGAAPPAPEVGIVEIAPNNMK